METIYYFIMILMQLSPGTPNDTSAADSLSGAAKL